MRITVKQVRGEAVGAVRTITAAVAVLIPAEVVAPEVPARVVTPRLIRRGDEEHLLPVRDERVATHHVALRTGPHPRPDVIVGDDIPFDRVVDAREEEQPLAVALDAVVADHALLSVAEQDARRSLSVATLFSTVRPRLSISAMPPVSWVITLPRIVFRSEYM